MRWNCSGLLAVSEVGSACSNSDGWRPWSWRSVSMLLMCSITARPVSGSTGSPLFTRSMAWSTTLRKRGVTAPSFSRLIGRAPAASRLATSPVCARWTVLSVVFSRNWRAFSSTATLWRSTRALLFFSLSCTSSMRSIVFSMRSIFWRSGLLTPSPAARRSIAWVLASLCGDSWNSPLRTPSTVIGLVVLTASDRVGLLAGLMIALRVRSMISLATPAAFEKLPCLRTCP